MKINMEINIIAFSLISYTLVRNIDVENSTNRWTESRIERIAPLLRGSRSPA